MKKGAFQFLVQHLRLGYISGLLVVDAFAVSLLLIDVWRFNRLGLSVRFAIRDSKQFLSSEQI
jgi:hypothetical protein